MHVNPPLLPRRMTMFLEVNWCNDITPNKRKTQIPNMAFANGKEGQSR